MKYAICNELFEGQPMEEYLRLVADLGYTGLEVAPFAFDTHMAEMTAAEAKAIGDKVRDHGLKVVGAHWLLARTEGLHITTPDSEARDRAAAYLTTLIRRTGDMGGSVMVFGSPQQRGLLPGVTEDEAFERAAQFFRRVAPVAQEEGITIALEPLARNDSSFLYTAAQGVRLVEMVGHPNVGLHLDVKAMSDEGTPIADIVRANAKYLVHFHVNDGKLGPGMGPIDYQPIMQALKDINYDGWVSLEVFDFTLGAEYLARESMSYLKRIESALV